MKRAAGVPIGTVDRAESRNVRVLRITTDAPAHRRASFVGVDPELGGPLAPNPCPSSSLPDPKRTSSPEGRARRSTGQKATGGEDAPADGRGFGRHLREHGQLPARMPGALEEGTDLFPDRVPSCQRGRPCVLTGRKCLSLPAIVVRTNLALFRKLS